MLGDGMHHSSQYIAEARIAHGIRGKRTNIRRQGYRHQDRIRQDSGAYLAAYRGFEGGEP